jgi:prepilin-type N-terminal cleavage/methylation domain-containing protein
MLKLRKNKKGFTLVELIVVIAIMAVLAGVVAGVTVSQLNKQTDKTGATQANTVATFISENALTGDEPTTQIVLSTLVDGADKNVFDVAKVKALIDSQYTAASIPVVNVEDNTTVGSDKGKVYITFSTVSTISVTVGGTATNISIADNVIVTYKPKASGTATTTFTISADGVVTKS